MLPDILGIDADLEAAAPQKFAFTAREEEFVEMAEPAEQVLSLFITGIAAAEVAIGLALIVAMFRARRTVESSALNSLKD